MTKLTSETLMAFFQDVKVVREIMGLPEEIPICGTDFILTGGTQADCYRVLSVGKEYPFPVVGIHCRPGDEVAYGTPETIIDPQVTNGYLKLQKEILAQGMSNYLKAMQGRLVAAVESRGLNGDLLMQMIGA